MNDKIHPDGAMIGLDGSCGEGDFEAATNLDPNVPIAVTELYPGWLRHWYENDWDSTDVSSWVQYYLEN